MRTLFTFGFTAAFASIAFPVTSQVIPDGSLGTNVNRVDDTFEIEGGEFSNDGTNLFHSFEAFGLDASQVANFVTTSEIQNVLGRVTGGDASMIDGMLQVTGSGADLFLMNPAGIVFGENASLNVAGDFTATTASGIGFEDGWFASIGEVNWSELVGDPTLFDFSGFAGESAGAIANFGDLSVNGDANLNLFGGTVISGGSLSGGNVSVTAVDAGNTLQLSAVGNVLGLEVATDRVLSEGIEPIALPELLTGGDLVSAGSLEIVDGVVTLSGAAIESGDSVVTGAIDVSSDDLGGVVQVLGDRVFTVGAEVDASGLLGGGEIYLGGEYRGGGTLPTAEFTVVDGGSVLDASAIESGDGGEVIVWADNTAGFFGEILARGGELSGDGGFVETSGAGTLVFRGGVDVDAANGFVGSVLLDPENITISNYPSTIVVSDPFSLAANASPSDVTILASDLQAITGNVQLEATNDITLAANLTFVAGDGSITLTADSDQVDGGAFLGSGRNIITSGRDITIEAAAVEFGNLSTVLSTSGGGDISVSAHDGGITIGSINSSAFFSGSGGAVTLTSDGGGITTVGQIVSSAGLGGNGGAVTLTSNGGGITVGEIFSGSVDPNTPNIGNGGAVTLTSDGGDITVGQIVSMTVNSGNGGAIALTSNSGGIITENLLAYSYSGDGGSVTITSSENLLVDGYIETYSLGESGAAGDLTLRSGGNLNTSGQITALGINDGAKVDIQAAGDVNLTGGIDAFGVIGTSDTATIGALNSDRPDSLRVDSIETLSYRGTTRGGITLQAAGNITVPGLLQSGASQGDTPSPIVVDSTNGNIDIGQARSTAFGARTLDEIATDYDAIAEAELTAAGVTSINELSNDNPTRQRVKSLNDLSAALRALSDTIPNPEADASAILLTAENGTVEADTLVTTSETAASGNIEIEAGSEVEITTILSDGETGSGDIDVTGSSIAITDIQSTNDTGDTTGSVSLAATDGSATVDTITTASNSGSGGRVEVSATEDVTITTVDTRSTTTSAANGGNVIISAPNGSVNLTNVESFSENGSGGNVNLTGSNGITGNANIRSYGLTRSGSLTISSDNNEVNLGEITTQSGSGPSGDIAINGNEVSAGNVSSIASTGSGNVEITATDGSVTTEDITTKTETGNSGNVTVTATGNVNTGNITSSTEGDGDSGDISVESETGSVVSEDVTTESAGGNSGNVNFSALVDLILGNLNSSGGENSGDINLDAGRDVTTGDITTQAQNGDSGDIGITAGRDITTGDIASIADNGTSGNIDLDAGRNINTGSITTQDGEITLDAGGEINTGELTSDNDILINGETLGLEDEIITPETLTRDVNTQTRQLETTQTDNTIQTVNTIQTDSSLNPNITSRATTSSDTSFSNNDRHNTNDLTLDISALGNLSTGLLTFVDTSLIDIAELDAERSDEYTNRLGGDDTLSGSVAATREAMARIEAETGIRTGASYIALRDNAIDLALLTAEGAPITATVPVDRATLLATVENYRNSLINRRLWRAGLYNDYAAQLYDWLIRPIAADLEALEVDTLMFSLDAGLRGIPMAALYDGENYLIENYSLSLIPSIGLIDTRYQPISDSAPMLAMGASEFATLAPLPAVPVELDVLVNHRRDGEILLNEDFTRQNLISERDRNPYPIVHLATHGEFNAGDLSNSYIQLWDEKIGLDNIRELGWHDPAVELLVLSACRTALGNDEAEMGFAGLAVAAGVKTAIASLWYVDDSATFLMMTELYDHLATAPIKAEALRIAQMGMINGNIRVANGMLYAAGIARPIPLPDEFASLADRDFSHPYYWSAFTAIGAPW